MASSTDASAAQQQVTPAQVLAVAKAVQAYMDNQLVLTPLKEPTIDFFEVSVLLKMQGIDLAPRAAQAVWETLVTGDARSEYPAHVEEDLRIPDKTAELLTLPNVIYALYHSDVNQGVEALKRGIPADCTSTVGLMVGPRPEHGQSALRSFAVSPAGKAVVAAQAQSMGRPSTQAEAEAALQQAFDALPSSERVALQEAAAADVALRARESILWEAEVDAAGDMLEMTVRTMAALRAGGAAPQSAPQS